MHVSVLRSEKRLRDQASAAPQVRLCSQSPACLGISSDLSLRQYSNRFSFRVSAGKPGKLVGAGLVPARLEGDHKGRPYESIARCLSLAMNTQFRPFSRCGVSNYVDNETLTEVQQRWFSAGAEEFTDLELAATFLANGSPGNIALAQARILLGVLAQSSDCRTLARELQDQGFPGCQTRAVVAGLHLCRRLDWPGLRPGQKFSCSLEIFRHFQPRMIHLGKECFWAVLLNGKNRLLRLVRVSEGSLTASLVHPREVFRPAVLEAAAGLLCVHNHPSGDPAPSPEDLQITRRLVEVGRLIGIRVLDHVIIGEDEYFSFADEGMI